MIMSPFRPSLPLRFPVREGCLCSISSTRQQHQQQPSTSTPCSISKAQQQEGDVWHSFSTVLDDTLVTLTHTYTYIYIYMLLLHIYTYRLHVLTVYMTGISQTLLKILSSSQLCLSQVVTCWKWCHGIEKRTARVCGLGEFGTSANPNESWCPNMSFHERLVDSKKIYVWQLEWSW